MDIDLLSQRRGTTLFCYSPAMVEALLSAISSCPPACDSLMCYNIVKGEAVIFFIYYLEFYIEFYFGFTFLLLIMMMKRHVTLQLHNMSHDGIS